ncbi:MAG: hypothetical protein U0165_18050 [Polyangiaceae bacterium]
MLSRDPVSSRLPRPLAALLLAVAVPLAASASFSCGGPPPVKNAAASSNDEPPTQEDPPLSLGPAGSTAPKSTSAKPVDKKGAIKLIPEGMRWGMSRADLETLVDKFVEDDYKAKLSAAKSPRVQEDIQAEITSKKKAFHRSYIDLSGAPTGLDSQTIAQEYTKGNGEGIMAYERGVGVRIYFLFIKDKLWKTYEEVKLVDGGLYGKDILEAAEKLVAQNGGSLPKFIAAAPEKGQPYGVNEWQDDQTHERVFEVGGNLAVVREDKVTLANIGNLRKNAAPVSSGAGAGVDSFIRGNEPPPKPVPSTPPKK